MDKIKFLNSLCAISNDEKINEINFSNCMLHTTEVNLFYEALQRLAEIYGANGNINVYPVDFQNASKFDIYSINISKSKNKIVPGKDSSVKLSTGDYAVMAFGMNKNDYLIQIISANQLINKDGINKE